MGLICHGLLGTSYQSNFLICSHEEIWVFLQPLLLRRGYQLRPRYDPNWRPSWTRQFSLFGPATAFEDGQVLTKPCTIDAIRIKDGMKVVMKIVSTSSNEIPIIRYLNSGALRSDPRNKTVPLLDVILFPHTDEKALIVMPMLLQFNAILFRYMNELCQSMEQFFVGLAFMHEHNIAHRDACYRNLMMDVTHVLPHGYHFACWDTEDGLYKRVRPLERRSVSPPDYFIIDFGLSSQFPPGVTGVKLRGLFGQDRTVPEGLTGEMYDPFKYDVYQLGNVLARLVGMYEGLTIFKPLTDVMTHRNPEERPSAAEAHRMLVEIVASLAPDQLDQRIWHRRTPPDLRYRIEFCGENPVEEYFD
ncbi:unnamed protein product [Cyclocybe aegerita]|uniref:Protein kinase domain-containing protein n=1 Tax=Cyclocybe aegerita TaxID=1973307 RepID=A0A8S0XS61_CYCAE|nr:unnamed protein product [Cyclocybe aegerita]